jgi:hypothetical protein
MGAVRAVAGAFVASRLIVLLVLLTFSQLHVVGTSFGIVQETRIDLRGVSLAPLVTGDAEWFRSISEDGYARGPFHTGEQKNWAFFPLFPLLVRWLGVLPGYALDAFLLTHFFFLAGLAMLHTMTLRAGFSEEIARRAVLYAAFFPTSYFFSLPVSESLFLLLGAACIAAALANRWLLAGLLGALASATRIHGVLLIVFLIVLCVQRRRPWRDALPIALVPLGLAAFCAFLWRTTGNAFAFFDIQRDWQRGGGNPLAPFATFFRELPVISTQWNFRALHLLAFALLVLAVIVLWRARQQAMATFVAACLLLPLATGSLQSMSRYLLSAFPAFIAFAALPWSDRTHHAVHCALAVLLGVLTVLFTLHVDIALA